MIVADWIMQNNANEFAFSQKTDNSTYLQTIFRGKKDPKAHILIFCNILRCQTSYSNTVTNNVSYYSTYTVPLYICL